MEFLFRTGDRVSAISAESPTPATPPPTPAERPQNSKCSN